MKSRLLLLVALLILMPLGAAAQTPVEPPAGRERPVGVLAEFDIDMLPTPHAEIWFGWMRLEPDGSSPMGPQTGLMILFTGSGTVDLALDGPVVLAKGAPAEEPGEVTLATGESILIPPGTGVGLANSSDQPTTVLFLLMYSAITEGEGEGPMEEPVGMTQGGLSVGTAEFMDVPATIVIERVVVEPGGTMESGKRMDEGVGPGWMGMDLGAVENGSGDLLIERQTFDVLYWPQMLGNEMSEPNPVQLAATVSLETGDAYAVFNGHLSWMATGSDPLTITRAVITPDLGDMGH